MKMMSHALQTILMLGAMNGIAPSLHNSQADEPLEVPTGYCNKPKPLSKKQKKKLNNRRKT